MLPVKRVVLYKHGMGYFEREGDISGDATLELQFKEDEMNDVLKSLTVIDLGEGLISSISYDSTKPLSRQLEEIALDLPYENVLSGLMNELKGAKVAVEVAGEEVEGEVVGIETINRRSYEVVITDHRLVLLTSEGGLKTIDLLEMRSLRFLETKIQKELQHLLKTLISSKKKDLKTLSIFARGEETRRINVSYILETPVWKTSYRILLAPPEKEDSPLVQGWAMVDNTQDEDWENVQLSLIAGLPVSFIHDLYSARYRQRPVVEVEEESLYGPPRVEESMATDFAAGAPPEGMAMMGEEVMDDFYGGGGGATSAARERSKTRAGFVQRRKQMKETAEVQKRTLEAGDFYAYDIENPVTVKRGQSALVPILSSEFEGEKIALYNPDIREKNPMAAILFKNTTEMTLEGGPVTVIEDEDYVGESMLDTVKPGDKKILPYAVELSCTVKKDHKSKEWDVHYSHLKDGYLSLDSYRLSEAIYKIHNRSSKEMTLYLEHRFKKSWELIDTPEPLEETDNFYRFSLQVPPESQTVFVVTEKGLQTKKYSVTNLNRKQLRSFLEADYLNEETEEELRKIVEMEEKISQLEGTIEQRKTERKGIFDNQERVRKNLEVLGEGQDEKNLKERYISQLSREEDRLMKINEEVENLEEEKKHLEEKLGEKIQGLQFKARVKSKKGGGK